MEEVTDEPFTMVATSSEATASNTGGTTDNMATASSTGGTTAVGGIATAQPVILRDYQALEIALPIGIITIIIVLTMVAIGVLLCVIRGRSQQIGRSQHKYDVPLSTPLNPTSLILDNSALYNTPRSM